MLYSRVPRSSVLPSSFILRFGCAVRLRGVGGDDVGEFRLDLRLVVVEIDHLPRQMTERGVLIRTRGVCTLTGSSIASPRAFARIRWMRRPPAAAAHRLDLRAQAVGGLESTLCFLGQPESSNAPANSNATDIIRFISYLHPIDV